MFQLPGARCRRQKFLKLIYCLPASRTSCVHIRHDKHANAALLIAAADLADISDFTRTQKNTDFAVRGAAAFTYVPRRHIYIFIASHRFTGLKTNRMQCVYIILYLYYIIYFISLFYSDTFLFFKSKAFVISCPLD